MPKPTVFNIFLRDREQRVIFQKNCPANKVPQGIIQYLNKYFVFGQMKTDKDEMYFEEASIDKWL